MLKRGLSLLGHLWLGAVAGLFGIALLFLAFGVASGSVSLGGALILGALAVLVLVLTFLHDRKLDPRDMRAHLMWFGFGVVGPTLAILLAALVAGLDDGPPG